MSLRIASPVAPMQGWLTGTLALDLNTVPPEIVKAIKAELTLYQLGFDGEGAMVPFYLETEDGWLHLPKGYPLLCPRWFDGSHGPRLQVQEGRSGGWPLVAGTHVAVSFGVDPFPRDQPKFIQDAWRAALANKHGGLMLAPTRSGKTLCVLAVCCHLGGSVLILVDRDPIMVQWIEAVRDHVRDGRGNPVPIGVVRGDRFDHGPGFPFVVGMLQTIKNRDLPEQFRRSFRTVVVDECQSAPTETVWTAVRRISSHYVLGPTATPDRGDGLEPAIPWVIGPEIAALHRDLDAAVWFLQLAFDDTVRVPDKRNRKCKPRLTRNGHVDSVGAEKALMANPHRVTRIAQEAINAQAAGGQVLILVGLRKHVRLLEARIKELGGPTPGVYIGGNSDRAAMQHKIVIATYGIAAKGVDFKPPPTLCILAGPRSDVRQAIGRALQPQAEHQTLILDVVDGGCEMAAPLIKQAYRRLEFYLRREFDVRNRVWGT